MHWWGVIHNACSFPGKRAILSTSAAEDVVKTLTEKDEILLLNALKLIASIAAHPGEGRNNIRLISCSWSDRLRNFYPRDLDTFFFCSSYPAKESLPLPYFSIFGNAGNNFFLTLRLLTSTSSSRALSSAALSLSGRCNWISTALFLARDDKRAITQKELASKTLLISHKTGLMSRLAYTG